MVASRLSRESLQLPLRRKNYHSLDELYTERDAISWYYRLAALTASWMILGGYLILPSTFDTDPDLRFSKSALAAIIAILLTCGYSLTALLWFFVPSPLFQSESVFYPALCSSLLGLLGTLYAFASSPRYTFSSSAGVAVALSTSSAAIYAVLVVWVQRRIAFVRSHAPVYQVAHVDMPRDGAESQASTAGLWQDPSYYKNYVQNMFPAAVANREPTVHARASFQSLPNRSPSPPLQPSGQGYYDPTLTPRAGSSMYNVTPSPGPQATADMEDEMVNQQMARLLLNTHDGQGNRSQNTFRIDWRTDEDDENNADNADPARRGILMHMRTGSGSRLIPPSRLAASQNLRGSTSSRNMRDESRAVPSAGVQVAYLARLSPFRGGNSAVESEAERGRNGGRQADNGGRGHARAKSREERRREIEMSDISAPSYTSDEERLDVKY